MSDPSSRLDRSLLDAHPAVLEASRQFNAAAERLSPLWALSDEFSEVLRMLEDGDQDTEALEAELDRIAGDIRHKAGNVARLIRTLEGLADWQKAEAKRIAEKAQANTAKANRLRDYVFVHLKQIGVDRVETGLFTLSIRQTPVSVQVLEAEMIPQEFRRVIPEHWEPDKVAIRDHVIATGEVVPGVELVRTESLSIR